MIKQDLFCFTLKHLFYCFLVYFYSLTDLEQSRDDLLFELHKQQQKSPTDENVLNNEFTINEHIKQNCYLKLFI